jgi:eukaryotic-like serine/threonine-protein kinase
VTGRSRAPSDGTKDEAPQEAVENDELSGGARIGRYVVLYRHGRGGMGHVYAAYDPELDRKVAIKLLRQSGGPLRQKRGRARLMREAQALARLSHLNVVAIHDVGLHDDRVFVAMEFLDGLTLRQFVSAETRTWREIVHVFGQAGRGLAAAHAAGLVHRDFKPENVIVGADGRVQVLDFGLARFGYGRASEEAGSAGSEEDRVIDLDAAVLSPLAPLTRDGALVGTPAYMAPEQHEGCPADARSDQFAFCVALHEALWAEHPFVANDREDLRQAVLRGHVREVGRARPVPGWVRAAIVRGLARNPDDRFPTMEHLLAVLGRDPWKRRRRIALTAVGTVIVGGLAYVGGKTLANRQNRCDGAEAMLAEIWNDEQRARAAHSFAATGKPYADAAWKTTERKLDAYAKSWIAERTEACEATWVRGEVPEEILLLRLGCLERRIDGLAALTELFAGADATVVLRSVQAIHDLEPVDRCTSIDAVGSGAARRSPEVRAKVEALRSRLAQVNSLTGAGHYSPALDLVETLVVEARDLDIPALLAEALLLEGRLELRMANTTAAERSLREAAFTAETGNAMDLAVRAWIELIDVARTQPHLAAESDHWERHASALLARIEAHEPIEAQLYFTLGNMRHTQGRYEEAVELHERALAIRERLHGPEHVHVGESLRGLGTALEAAGRFDEAVQQHRRAVTLLESLLGVNHPDVAQALSDLAIAYDDLAQEDKARPLYERAVEIFERSHGPDHPQVAAAINNLAAVLYADGDFENAGILFGRALTIWENTYGPEHPDVALTLGNLGLVSEGLGRHEEAIEYHRRALALRERTLGTNHPEVAVSLQNLGDLYQYRAEYEVALQYHERAIEVLQQALGPYHPRVATSMIGAGIDRQRLGDNEGALESFHAALRIRSNALDPRHMDLADASGRLGIVWLELGATERARTHLESAIEIYDQADSGFAESGEMRFARARLLWDLGPGERRRALELAHRALEDYQKDPFAYPAEQRAVSSWLRRREGVCSSATCR